MAHPLVKSKIESKKRLKLGDKVGDKVGDKLDENLTENQKNILGFILSDNRISAHELSVKVGISQRKVEVNIRKLRIAGLLKRIGSAKGGHWVVIENTK